MFAVDHVLVSDHILDAPFACNLGACFGACCVHGDRGAPLEPEEREKLEAVLPIVEDRLPEAARETIRREGVWVEEEDGFYGTATVGNRECVFVTFEGPVAKCAIQQAFFEGRTDWEKPISCHLFPIRAERHGSGPDAIEVLNVERLAICRPAIRHAEKTATQLADFLERPLTRKYGPRWFRRFREAVAARREAIAPS